MSQQRRLDFVDWRISLNKFINTKNNPLFPTSAKTSVSVQT
jgi:hypothetical protein